MSDVRNARVALWEALERARANPASVERELVGPAIDLARAIASCRCRHLSGSADVEHVQSVAGEAAWTTLRRINLSMANAQIIRYLSERCNHAVSDAARDVDPLPRRARTYRNRVLSAADAADEETVRRMARMMYPTVTARTLELIARGAPPSVDIDRAEVLAMLTGPTLDPSESVVDQASVDAVHVAIADHPDAGFRAWAARVLCGESDGRRLPAAYELHAAVARRNLEAWV
jgi:hypothetical protein